MPNHLTEAGSRTGNVMLVADIHFNPFYDTSILSALIASDYKKWDEIFAASHLKGIMSYGQETNYVAFDSLVKSMVSMNKNPDFIVFAGDFLSHKFDSCFYQNSKCTSKYSLYSFIYKTIAFMTDKFLQHYPHTPVYFTLGNNDAYEGDYQLVYDGEFLHTTAQLLFDHFIKHKKNRDEFFETYPVGGYYKVTLPNVDKGCIISLNTTYFSVNSPAPVGGIDPAQIQMKWLQSQLKECVANKQKVWLLLHIPMGVNVFGTINDNAGSSTVQSVRMQWKDGLTEQFVGLIQQYSAVIEAAISGHIHMDDFRIISGGNPPSPEAFVHIMPAVTPDFGNNPAFQILSYDRSRFSFLDCDTYYMNIASQASRAGEIIWDKEYLFSDAYGKKITPSSLGNLYNAIGNDTAICSKYVNFYSVSCTPSQIQGQVKYYRCGIANLTADDFKNSYNK